MHACEYVHRHVYKCENVCACMCTHMCMRVSMHACVHVRACTVQESVHVCERVRTGEGASACVEYVCARARVQESVVHMCVSPRT